jgi:soluble lytic murein transglycosylase-like protein
MTTYLVPITATALIASVVLFSGCSGESYTFDDVQSDKSRNYQQVGEGVARACGQGEQACKLAIDGAWLGQGLTFKNPYDKPKATEVAQAEQSPKPLMLLEQTALASQVPRTIPSPISTKLLRQPSLATPAKVASSDGRPLGKAWEALNPQQRYQWVLKDYAYRHGVPFEIAHSQINQESGFRARVCSNAGACGIAQFIATTAKRFKVNRNDPHSSLDGAMRYMAKLRKDYGGWEVALAAYNGGADGARLAQHGFSPDYGRQLHAKRKAQGSYFDWKQNKHYVSSIMSNAQRMGYGG